MEYAKDEIFEVEFKEKRTSNKFLKIIIVLTIIFSIVNCICIYDYNNLIHYDFCCIYDFYKLLCKL